MSKKEERAKALKKAAKYFEKNMGAIWGGNAMWITTGNHIAELVGGILNEMAEEELE